MSDSFYHKDLTEAQWNRIKLVFEEPSKVGRPPLNIAEHGATRYDKLALCFENFLLLAASVIHF